MILTEGDGNNSDYCTNKSNHDFSESTKVEIKNRRKEVTEILEREGLNELLIRESLEEYLTIPLKENVKDSNKPRVFKNKVLRKIERYYPMYENYILFKLDSLLIGDETVEEIENIVKNMLDDVNAILFTFRESLSPKAFASIIMMESIEIHDICGKIQKNYEIIKNNHGQGTGRILGMYRHFVHDGLKAGKTDFDIVKMSGKIEDHFQQSFIQIGDIFLQWYYSPLNKQGSADIQIEDKRVPELLGIKLLFQELIEDIAFLKKHKIAFTESIIEEIPLSIGKGILEKKRKGWKNHNMNEGQLDFFNKIVQSPDDDSFIIEDFIKDIVISKRNELKLEEPLNIAEKSFPSIDGKDNLSYSDYQHASPDERKKYFLSVLGIESLESNPSLKTISLPNPDYEKEIFEEFIQFFMHEYPKHGLSIDSIKEKYIKALADFESSQSILEFEENYIESEQILVGWFRYYLMYKEFNGDKEKISAKKHELYGTKEAVLLALENNELLKGESENIKQNNISFVGGDIVNSGIWDTDTMIKRYRKQFTHKPVDLRSESFGLKLKKGTTEEGLKFFKDMPDLYLLEEDSSIGDLERVLMERLEICNKILQGREKTFYNEPFVKVLDYYGIDIKDSEQIWKLRKFIKYVLFLTVDVGDILKDSEDDRRFFEQNFPGDNVGPDKKAGRVLSKIVKDNNGDPRKISDLVRMRYVEKTFCNTIDAMNEFLGKIKQDSNLNEKISQVLIEDNTGNPHELSNKPSGYRDINLTLQLQSGNLVEIQFLTSDIYQYKNKAEGKSIVDLVELYTGEGIILNQTMVTILEKEAAKRDIKLPRGFQRLFVSSVQIDGSCYSERDKFSADEFYNLWRDVDEREKDYIKILQRMERIPNQKAWGKIVSQMTQRILGGE